MRERLRHRIHRNPAVCFGPAPTNSSRSLLASPRAGLGEAVAHGEQTGLPNVYGDGETPGLSYVDRRIKGTEHTLIISS